MCEQVKASWVLKPNPDIAPPDTYVGMAGVSEVWGSWPHSALATPCLPALPLVQADDSLSWPCWCSASLIRWLTVQSCTLQLTHPSSRQLAARLGCISLAAICPVISQALPR